MYRNRSVYIRRYSIVGGGGSLHIYRVRVERFTQLKCLIASSTALCEVGPSVVSPSSAAEVLKRWETVSIL